MRKGKAGRAKAEDAKTLRGKVKGGRRAQEKSNASKKGWAGRRYREEMGVKYKKVPFDFGEIRRGLESGHLRIERQDVGKHDPSKRVFRETRKALDRLREDEGITREDAAVIKREIDRLNGKMPEVVQTLRLANGGVIRVVGADQIDIEKYRGLEITFRFIDELVDIPQAQGSKSKRKGGQRGR